MLSEDEIKAYRKSVVGEIEILSSKLTREHGKLVALDHILSQGE